jgi:hypothetical protein
MRISNRYPLEPATWDRFLIFLVAVLTVLLLLSFFAPAPQDHSMPVYSASD